MKICPECTRHIDDDAIKCVCGYHYCHGKEIATFVKIIGYFYLIGGILSAVIWFLVVKTIIIAIIIIASSVVSGALFIALSSIVENLGYIRQHLSKK